MNTDKLLGMLLEAIDYSFLQTDGSYDKTLTYPVIDKIQYIKEQVKNMEVKEVDLEKSIDVDSMVTEYLKQYEEAGQTPFAMNIIGSAYRKGLEDMFRLKAQEGE